VKKLDDHAVGTVVPGRRVVLVGASNLTRGMATAIQTAQAIWEQPLEIMVAAGLGRSYGLTSRILGRSLPSILSCGLWENLQAGRALPTTALLTDIGNDLLYGASVKQLVTWVETCIERLRKCCQEIVLARLPMDSIGCLNPWKFAFMRRLLFPGSRITLNQIQERAMEVDQQLLSLSRNHELHTVQPQSSWYGMDPIHVRARYLGVAWPELLGRWVPVRDLPRINTTWQQRRYFRSAKPLHRTVFGMAMKHEQPSRYLKDGSNVSFY
jgi:hypothetical protein